MNEVCMAETRNAPHNAKTEVLITRRCLQRQACYNLRELLL